MGGKTADQKASQSHVLQRKKALSAFVALSSLSQGILESGSLAGKETLEAAEITDGSVPLFVASADTNRAGSDRRGRSPFCSSEIPSL